MCCSSQHGYVYHVPTAETYPRDASRYCKCLGVDKGHTTTPADDGGCCGAATGADGLCDRCRTTCNQPTPTAAADTDAAQPATAGVTG